MQTMKRILLVFIFVSFFVAFGNIATAQAPEGTILPKPQQDCEVLENDRKVIRPDLKPAFESKTGFEQYVQGDRNKLQDALGCAVKLGRIRLFMAPYFVTYLIQFLLGLAGLVAVLFVVYGGFKYVVGGVSEDKEAGKKIITHALLGLLVALSAWIVINFIQVALTS